MSLSKDEDETIRNSIQKAEVRHKKQFSPFLLLSHCLFPHLIELLDAL